ncbi:MAG: spondin domain-containing protein [Acidimicrobiia bacterium]
MRRARMFAILAVVALLTALVAAPAASADEPRTYQVTVTNLTSGQPFTPALVATHKGNDGLFTVGAPASVGLQEISENGNLDPMAARVSNDASFAELVIQTGATGVPPVMPGETVSFAIAGGPPFNFISWTSMLICSNDGFTGVDSLKLPNEVGESISVSTQGYDAGTEINTEMWADLVPPCGPLTGQDNMGQGTGMSNPALAENGVIHHHSGILGVGDLDPAINNWANPVATITVERTG